MIRAMDLQNVFSKTQLVEKLYQTVLHHPDQSQRQFALQMLQKVHEDQRRPQEAAQKDSVEIHRDRDGVQSGIGGSLRARWLGSCEERD